MNTLRKLVEKASEDLEIYKQPDISEACEKLDEVLKAAGLETIGQDKVDYIHIHKEEIGIKTSWSARNCPQQSYIQFPSRLLDAPDPVKAAKVWAIENELNKARNSKGNSFTQYQYWVEREAKLSLELEALKANL